MGDMHISGLGQTTFDISGIIDKMVTAKAATEKAWIAEQDAIAEDVSAWADISSLMTNLTDSLDTLRGYDLWNAMATTISDETKLTATASTSAVAATYSVAITTLAQAHSVRSSAFASTTADLTPATLTDGHQFDIGGVTFTVGADEYGQTVGGTESLTTLAAKINYASSSMTATDRVTASIVSADPTTNYLVLTRVDTGDTYIDSADTGGGTALQDLAIRTVGFPGPSDNYVTNLVAHQDAVFSINTISMTRSGNTGITDAINGVTLNLLDQTVAAVTLTVAQDRTTVKAAILDFIDQYNAVAAKLDEYGKIETNGSELDPNGAAVDTANLGKLYDDPLLDEIARNIRLQATGSKYPYLNPVNASYTYGGGTGIMSSLQDVGIGTVSRTNALSVLDENRLDSLLASDFDKVEQLFRGVYDPIEGYQHGVASDFYAYANGVSTSMTGAIAQHVGALDDKNARLQQQIDDYDAYLEDYEQTLWLQFTAMDTAITEMQSNLAGLGNLGK